MSFAWQEVLQPNGFWPPSLQFAVLCGDGWLVGAAPNMEFAPADYVVGAQETPPLTTYLATLTMPRGLLLRY